MTPHHPCGNLPVYWANYTAFYCAHHQAWWCHAEVIRQDGEEATSEVYSRSMELGPFDTVEDVQRWLEDRIKPSLAIVLDRNGADSS